ncbi:PREDICTED: neurofilament medium polypeptide isoform X2 [Ipomoea nil]|uniref:neurofilament medium polypeptide isoform X2 n=1 Tax=Ipomoea nil TaxID=35883 RepID=UPI00090195D0|nr:PREDICTED: neurofilament medium polypeptide isoform X2 [Ipomoea nil]
MVRSDVMGSLKVADSLLSKCISSTTIAPQSLGICRGFVSATRPSQKEQAETMIDKETCEKVIEAANAITESAREVRHVVRDVKEAVAIGAESAAIKVAEKAMEQAAEGEEEEEEAEEEESEEKGSWEKVTKTITKQVLGDKKSN